MRAPLRLRSGQAPPGTRFGASSFGFAQDRLSLGMTKPKDGSRAAGFAALAQGRNDNRGVSVSVSVSEKPRFLPFGSRHSLRVGMTTGEFQFQSEKPRFLPFGSRHSLRVGMTILVECGANKNSLSVIFGLEEQSPPGPA